ncbi:hypothetical protein D1872_290170 [compost metagenome]
MDHLCILLLLRAVLHEYVPAIPQAGVRSLDAAGHVGWAAATHGLPGEYADRPRSLSRRDRAWTYIRQSHPAARREHSPAWGQSALLHSVAGYHSNTNLISDSVRAHLSFHCDGAA